MRDYRLLALINEPSLALTEVLNRHMLPEGTRSTSKGLIMLPLAFTSHSDNQATAKLPGLLENESVKVVLLSTELGHKGAYAYIIAGPSGEKLKPRSLHIQAHHYDHHGQARFAGRQLGRVMWQKRPDGGCRVSIDRAHAELTASEAVVYRTTVYMEVLRTSAAAPKLPLELAGWQPAVQALFDRLSCSGQSCGSHYYAEG